MLLGEAGAYLEKLAGDKHSSLLRKLINYGQKKFNKIGPRWNNEQILTQKQKFDSQSWIIPDFHGKSSKTFFD